MKKVESIDIPLFCIPFFLHLQNNTMYHLDCNERSVDKIERSVDKNDLYELINSITNNDEDNQINVTPMNIVPSLVFMVRVILFKDHFMLNIILLNINNFLFIYTFSSTK